MDQLWVTCKHRSCLRVFDSKTSMLQHYTDVHDSQVQKEKSERVYVCLQCRKSFENFSSADQHCVDAHELSRQLSELVLNNASTSTTMMDVACNDCGRMFRSLDYLHQHQWDSDQHTRVSNSRTPIPVRECSQCDSGAFRNANDLEQHFMDVHPLSQVAKKDEAWREIGLDFERAWKNPNTTLHGIHKIFKVYNMGWRRNGYEQYRQQLKSAMNGLKEKENAAMRKKVLENGNEQLMYHGTRVKCRLGETNSQQLCSDGGCSLCRILKSGFKKSKCRVEHFLRFGRGIYVSGTSSKANDYVKCSQGDGQKVLLVCRVLAGRVHRSVRNLQHLTNPPDGFHSVKGDPGEILNYDELVVYNDRAILPAYIILYSSD